MCPPCCKDTHLLICHTTDTPILPLICLPAINAPTLSSIHLPCCRYAHLLSICMPCGRYPCPCGRYTCLLWYTCLLSIHRCLALTVIVVGRGAADDVAGSVDAHTPQGGGGARNDSGLGMRRAHIGLVMMWQAHIRQWLTMTHHGWTRGAEEVADPWWLQLNVEVTIVVLTCIFAIGLTTAAGGLHGGGRNGTF